MKTEKSFPWRWLLAIWATVFVGGIWYVATDDPPSSARSDDVPGFDEAAQIGVPSKASVFEEATDLLIGTDSAISPSGMARVSPQGGQWCLERDGAKRCIDAASEGSASFGLHWRGDESAIVVTDGSAGLISIIDFEVGEVVETDLDSFRILDWAPGGVELVGVHVEDPTRFVRIDSRTLETESFGELESSNIPHLIWPLPDLIWGSASNEARVFVMNSGGENVELIEGGLGEQDILSIDGRGRLALALDDDVTHGAGGEGDAALHIFDAATLSSTAIRLPNAGVFGKLSVESAQLSAGGNALLVLASRQAEPFGYSLLAVGFEPDDQQVGEWTELASWEGDDPLLPALYASQGQLQWDGGPTAWLFTEARSLLRIELSP